MVSAEFADSDLEDESEESVISLKLGDVNKQDDDASILK